MLYAPVVLIELLYNKTLDMGVIHFSIYET